MAPNASRSRLRAAATVLALLLAGPASTKTLRTIAVDGNLDDWTGVLLDRDQKVADRSLAQGDPDIPPQSQRDERGVAFTWDATNLYLYFSRTGSGTNSFNAIFYFDLGHDGLMSSADRIALFKMTGSNFNGFELDAYDDGGTPDAMTGDGASLPGLLGATLTTLGGNAACDPNGIAFEASIAWASLGVTAGQAMFIHPAISSNTNLPAGVQDNTDVLDTRVAGVLISAGTTNGTAPGRFVDFPHRLTNDGAQSDVVDLSVRTRSGFAVATYSDPNGDGDPADGALLARDGNGDGDTSDAGDTAAAPGSDANGNLLVDGGTLAAGASRSFVLRVTVPAGTSATQELVQAFAASGYRPSVRAQALDTLDVGLLSITPPRSVPAAAGQGARLAHVACNQSGSARVLDLAFDSAMGWSGSFRSDPDGDGDPSEGAALADTDADGLVDLGTLADGACAAFVLTMSVPPGTAGATDAVEVTVSDGPGVSQVVADSLESTGARVDVRPNRTAKGQKGKTLYLRHDARNASLSDDTYSLALSSTLGSQVAAMDDPDDDGTPDTSAVVVSTGLLAAGGGRFPVLSRVRIPGTAVHGNVDVVDTTASSSASDFARDTISIVGTLTYSDALFARPASEFFGQCSVIYVLAYRSGGGTYRFAWYDPSNVLRRASADLTPYSDGSLDDFFDCGAAPAMGSWTVRLQARSGGGTYSDVGADGTTTFTLQDLVAGGARVALNDTGSDLYLSSGEMLAGYADLQNPTAVDILGSRVEHVAFRDADAGGGPSAGEEFVRADGTIGSWAPGSVTASRAGVELHAGETWSDSFTTPPVTYTTNGPWKLQTQWIASCGVLLSTRIAAFTVGCQPPPSFAGIASADDVHPCEHSGIRLTWPAASSWGLGTTGTYAVYRSDVPGFTPDASTLLAAGLAGSPWIDASAAPGTAYDYVVRAESDVTCSDGPNNAGLLDSNFVHASAADEDAGVIPSADFTSSSPDCLVAGSALMTFSDASTGPPASWEWDFDGDGLADAVTESASHAFTTPGDHLVRLTVTNACGTDLVTRTVTVGAPPSAVISASRTETCVGTPVALDGSLSSAVAPSAITGFSWDFDGDGIADSSSMQPGAVQWSAPGTYAVALDVVDSLGCSATARTDVVVNDLLSVAVAAPIVDSCTGLVSVASIVSGGRAPFSWSWDILTDDGLGTGSATFGRGTSQVATVTVVDSGGCTAQARSAAIVVNPELTVTLQAPVIDACTGLVTLRAEGAGGDGTYTYAWTTLVDDGAGTGSAVLPAGSSTETVTVTDGAGCTAQATSAGIVVNPELTVTLQAPVIDACTGLVTLRAEGAGGDGTYTYSWSRLVDDGAGTGSSVLPPGTLPETVTVTDGAGCTAQATSAPIVVNPELGVTLYAPVIDACTGEVTIRAQAAGGNGGWVFSWTSLVDDGSGFAVGTLAPGTHVEDLTLTDDAGCVARASVTFTIPEPPRADFEAAVTYVRPGEFRADVTALFGGGVAPFAPSWDVGADGVVDGSGPSISFPMSAQQVVPLVLVITDANGCIAVVRRDVAAAGCAVDTPVRLLMGRKEGAGIAFTWEASTHACHGRYELLEAVTARPALDRTGSFPLDPAWSTVSDADGSDQEPRVLLADPHPGESRFFLVRDGGTDGSWGPVESYGNTGVTR